MTSTRSPLRVGLFVEGSPQEYSRNSIDKPWAVLAARCRARHTIKVYGIDKGQILDLRRDLKPMRKGATRVCSGRPALDIEIDRAFRNDDLDCMIIAFDAAPPNELIPHSCLRAEVLFLLESIGQTKVDGFPKNIREKAKALLLRYKDKIPPRRPEEPTGPLEVIYMKPAFESLLCSDEKAVLRATGHASRPNSWPSFKPKSSDDLMQIMPKATRVAHKDVLGKIGGEYKTRKSAWALRVIEEAIKVPDAEMWKHEIATRLCRLLATATCTSPG